MILHLYQPAKGERIVYVAIVGATIRFDGISPTPWALCSLPLTQSALRESLVALEDPRTNKTFPELEKKYVGWKKNADDGNVQFWTKSISVALSELEARIRKSRAS